MLTFIDVQEMPVGTLHSRRISNSLPVLSVHGTIFPLLDQHR